MRLISLVPSITELLADLGLDDEVVGVTRFCVHPVDWKSRKRIVGGTKNVIIERIRELSPDLVLATREENVREQVEEIAAFARVEVFDVVTVREGIEMIRSVGRLVDRTEKAEILAHEIGQGFQVLRECITKPIPAAYLIWKNPYMTIGGDTFISDVMNAAGFRNVFEDELRYPEVTAETLANSGAQVIFLSSEPFPFKTAHANELESETNLPCRIVDGEMFSWYGSRMRLMPEYLARVYEEVTGSS